MYYIIGAAVVIVILLVVVFMKFQQDLKRLDVQYVHDFIEKNKDNSSFSMYVVHNGRVLMDINRHAMIPLASTVKIIIAIEYAHQAAEGRIDPDERVTVDALDRHYFKNLDGGAHESWLKTVDAEAITFEQVAKGMILYSSNANTDFLLTKLGIDKVNERLKLLDLVDHTSIYPLVSALYVPLYLSEEKRLGVKEIAHFLNQASIEEFMEIVSCIHEKVVATPFTEDEKLRAKKLLTLDVQKALSNKQSSSTTGMYVQLMQRLNEKHFLPESVHVYLDRVLEQVMANDTYKRNLKHLGRKGGSTAFLLTEAMYATDYCGNTLALAFFANDLTMLEQEKLTLNLR